MCLYIAKIGSEETLLPYASEIWRYQISHLQNQAVLDVKDSKSIKIHVKMYKIWGWIKLYSLQSK